MPQDSSPAGVVHIVDDDDTIRVGLDILFRAVGHQTRTYGSASEFLNSSREDLPGCIVLDVRLPGTSGLDFQEQLLDLGIQLPVILITGHGDIPMTVRAMKAGAVDFLSKPFREQDILDAVAASIERDRKRRAADSGSSLVRDRYTTLSLREQQVMRLVAAGKMNKQVAAELGLSVVTVKIHRGAAMRKMGARSLADLVRMADTINAKAS